MKVLAIDTSNLVMGISVVDDGKVVGELITNLKKNHSLRLMPAISDLLEEVNIKPKELDKIIVAKGPGSYTGVRIGVTTAKSLAWSLQIPLVGISSLEVLAQNGRYFDGYVSPLFDARRGQVYTGLYGMVDRSFLNVKEDKIILLHDWLTVLHELEKPVLFIGNDLDIHREQIKETFGAKAVFAAISEHNPRPSELAMLGLEREPTENVHQFTPEYIQLAEAEANWIALQKKREQ
ncbi:tRNA (adenosine(37)-N6)-threonylcarbamoyltransferase complex dimerization subunit type 1 TsaB [Anaerobacillus sp. MEB173]|uniref:tRNA (adenosine(37)-N6)-threonylcarbamoyltransferase complex dimerization subunit type 1 TsaB n=1 Tax=Anaerobacillus sp. MEB173 TaxID=3383345 RepID=UPI003F91E91D